MVAAPVFPGADRSPLRVIEGKEPANNRVCRPGVQPAPESKGRYTSLDYLLFVFMQGNIIDADINSGLVLITSSEQFG